MRTFHASEAKWLGLSPDKLFYIKYLIKKGFDGVEEQEFWTDTEEEYQKKLGFILRHIYSYKLLDNRSPIC